MTESVVIPLNQEQQDQATVTTAETKIVEDAANIQTNEQTVTNSTPQDFLENVIAAGIKQYDGYPEQAAKVSALRDLQKNSGGMTQDTRDLLAKTIAYAWQ